MILHLAFNTFFVFLVLAGAIELLLHIFRIKNARVRMLCRLLPVAKLPLDFLVFGLFGESFLVNLNPFSCEIFFNSVLKELMPAGARSDLSIPSYIASKMSPYAAKALMFGIAAFSAFKVIQKWRELIRSLRFVKKIRHTSSPCHRLITNARLNTQLQKRGAKIVTSSGAQVPFAAGSRLIVLPESLVAELSQAEFESIVSHEFEHLKWKDPVIKVVSNFLFSIFWWIPTKWWMKRLEMDQERASDSSVHKYNIEPLSLAQAFVKTAGHLRANTTAEAAICSFASQNSMVTGRLEHILNSQQVAEDKLKRSAVIALSLLAAVCVWSC